MSTVEMHEHLARTASNCSLVSGTAYGVVRGTRNGLKKLASAFLLIVPDLDPICVLSQIRSRRSTSAAFADGVADIGAFTDQIDAAAVLHSTRSYWGFQPRPIPLLIKEDAMKS